MTDVADSGGAMVCWRSRTNAQSRSLHLKTGRGSKKKTKKKKKNVLSTRSFPSLAVRGVGLKEDASTVGRRRHRPTGGWHWCVLRSYPSKEEDLPAQIVTVVSHYRW